jgi:uncharacterized membrane protein
MIAQVMFYLALAWGIINILWMIILFVKKSRREVIPQEFTQTIHKTIRVNFYYVIIFLFLGFLFL